MQQLKFNSKIYKKKAIREAVSVYSHLADFSIVNGQGYIKVKIDRIKPSLRDIIVDEFANYVLGVGKNVVRT